MVDTKDVISDQVASLKKTIELRSESLEVILEEAKKVEESIASRYPVNYEIMILRAKAETETTYENLPACLKVDDQSSQRLKSQLYIHALNYEIAKQNLKKANEDMLSKYFKF